VSRPLPGTGESTGLLIARLLGGGLFALAGFLKLQSPKAFALSIGSLKVLPPGMQDTLAPILAYFVPWLEITLGLALVAGLWAREAALLLALTVTSFTIALASVIARGMSVDCGCFGDALDGIFGGSKVGWHSIARNVFFLMLFSWVAFRGGGAFSLDARLAAAAPPPSAEPEPAAG
jgi:uncharacterized membrane protein YphA (DoxX/SURF4 family)